MNIILTRRISQIFFFIVFLWFCIVTSLGTQWWQLRGWPVNWIMELDPLVGLATLLTTGTLYAGLLWGLATIVLTIILGRFFCGWICPFGSMHQFIGYWGHRKKSVAASVKINRYHSGQFIKYWILTFLLAVAFAELAVHIVSLPRTMPWLFGLLCIIVVAAVAVATIRQNSTVSKKTTFVFLGTAGLWLLLSLVFSSQQLPSASLQIGLLDPIPLVYRSINLIVLPLMDRTALKLSTIPRHYDGIWLIGTIFTAALLLNLIIPRFYCRFICPLGALFGIFSRFAIWRIGKSHEQCTDCHLCEKNCEGACQPTTRIRISECVLCLNCLGDCHHSLMGYRVTPSATGEIVSPDITRRKFLVAAASGIAAIPVMRLSGYVGPNWNPGLVRPPGALPEKEFLSRCIKCGQCMRICPTNVIHPAGLEGGFEGLWTPVLNFRIGTSGCQFNCIACGNLCPTAAIRPISMEERLGLNQFASAGPIKTGTAFFDRGRCLPWAMDKPCIVCQENCPVSPKAIFTREYYSTLNMNRPLAVGTAGSRWVELNAEIFKPDQYATGDYFCILDNAADRQPHKIVSNTTRHLEIDPGNPFPEPPAAGDIIRIQVRLQRPYLDPERCIGCGVCQHECPVQGKRAVRVTADNETRNKEHAMLLKT